MRLVKRFCFVLLVVCVVLFAVLNSHAVRLNLLLTPAGFRLPLSLLVVGVFFAGFLLGSGAGLLRRLAASRRSRSAEDVSETKETS